MTADERYRAANRDPHCGASESPCMPDEPCADRDFQHAEAVESGESCMTCGWTFLESGAKDCED